MKRSVTMLEVARRAETSVASVSRVLSAKDAVSEDLRARVLGAISDMGYVLNPVARSLSTAVTNCIGLISLLENAHEHASLMLEIIGEINGRGMKAVVQLVQSGAGLPIVEMKSLRGSVDQLIVLLDRRSGGIDWIAADVDVGGIILTAPSTAAASLPKGSAKWIVDFAVDMSGLYSLASILQPPDQQLRSEAVGSGMR